MRSNKQRTILSPLKVSKGWLIEGEEVLAATSLDFGRLAGVASSQMAR